MTSSMITINASSCGVWFVRDLPPTADNLPPTADIGGSDCTEGPVPMDHNQPFFQTKIGPKI